MDKQEKKIAKKLSEGEFETIKAANDVIDTIIGLAEEEITSLRFAIAKEENDENDETSLPSDSYIEALNARIDYLEKIVDNGRLLLEQREIAEELLSNYNMDDDF